MKFYGKRKTSKNGNEYFEFRISEDDLRKAKKDKYGNIYFRLFSFFDDKKDESYYSIYVSEEEGEQIKPLTAGDFYKDNDF